MGLYIKMGKVKKDSTKKKRKVKKDGPKRGKSAYIFFSQEERIKVMKE